MSDFVKAISLLLALLNPFLVIIYILDVVQSLDQSSFRRVLIRAAFIATAVFVCFALAGDAIFSSIIQAEFASFQIFGGIVFLLIGLQYVSHVIYYTITDYGNAVATILHKTMLPELHLKELRSGKLK